MMGNIPLYCCSTLWMIKFSGFKILLEFISFSRMTCYSFGSQNAIYSFIPEPRKWLQGYKQHILNWFIFVFTSIYIVRLTKCIFDVNQMEKSINNYQKRKRIFMEIYRFEQNFGICVGVLEVYACRMETICVA